MKSFLVTVALSPLLLAFPSGAPSGAAGVEGETTCLNCHRGIRANTGGGNVTVTFPGSLSYVPGIRQRLKVTLNDTAGVEYGFQATARVADSPKKPGGTFSAPAQGTRVACWSGSSEEDDINKPAAGCPADKALETIVQNRPIMPAGAGTASWEFDWTPPAGSVGPVKVYVAANANVGPDEANARVYTASYTLQPVANPGKPSITRVSSPEGYSASSTFAPGSWILISGANLSSSIRPWSGIDFRGDAAPVDLDSVQVKFSGRAGAISAEALDALSVQIPAGVGPGRVALTVSVGGVSSDEFMIQVAERAPVLAVRNIRGQAYAQAALPTGQAITPAGGGPGGGNPGGGGNPPGGGAPPPGGPGGGGGFQGRQAAAGDVLTVAGLGFGATINNAPHGIRAPAGSLLPSPEVRVAGKPATVLWAGLIPGILGVYQFNFVVPDGVSAGDSELVVSAGGVAAAPVILPTR